MWFNKYSTDGHSRGNTRRSLIYYVKNDEVSLVYTRQNYTKNPASYTYKYNYGSKMFIVKHNQMQLLYDHIISKTFKARLTSLPRVSIATAHHHDHDQPK